MKIDLYTRCWNDGAMLGFFFRHYDEIVRRYVVYDDGSTDNSREILRSHRKVDLRALEYSDPDSRVASGQILQNACWKESRGDADWVIVTDIDEHLHHAQLALYLDDCRRSGVTAIPSLGYQMLSEEFPREGQKLCETLTFGEPSEIYSKMNIFSPDAIEETNFNLGRHTAKPVGRVVIPARDELLLLHYRYLGFERTQKRHEEYLTRQRKRDLEKGWGIQYSWSREALREVWDGVRAGLVDVSDPALRPWETRLESFWWHGYPRLGAEGLDLASSHKARPHVGSSER